MYLGIDIGSVSTNAVILNNDKKIVGYSIVSSGFDHKTAIDKAIRIVCSRNDISDNQIKSIVSTGYGRKNVAGVTKAITEISCHARGIHYFSPQTRTLIDIGGQDSKVIRIDEDGFVDNFVMNDKCAAGTGRFLDVMAHAMEIDIQLMGDLSLQAKSAIRISSTCTVFAESEIISKIAEGKPKESIVAGIHQAIGERITGMANSIGIRYPVALSGGVAKNKGVLKAVGKYLDEAPFIPEEPQIIGALGAAIFAWEESCKLTPGPSLKKRGE